MSGFLDAFRSSIQRSVYKDAADMPEAGEINDKIALGTLLWIVAEADEQFLPQEMETIKTTLRDYGKVPESDIPLIMATIEAAARERIDLYAFTHEIGTDLPYPVRLSVVEQLFRIACVDKQLDDKELSTIRTIAGLFHIAHRDFIDAKIRIKKEFALPVHEGSS